MLSIFHVADIAPLVPKSRGTEAGAGRDRCLCGEVVGAGMVSAIE